MTQKTKVANVFFRIVIFLGLIASIVGIVEMCLIALKENYSTNTAVIYYGMANNLFIWTIAFMVLTGISVLAFIMSFVSHKAVGTLSYVLRTIFIFVEALINIILCTVAYVFNVVAAVLLGYLPVKKVYEVNSYIDDVDKLETLVAILVFATIAAFIFYLILSVTSIVSLHKMNNNSFENASQPQQESYTAQATEEVTLEEVVETPVEQVKPTTETVAKDLTVEPETVAPVAQTESTAPSQDFSGFNNN